MAKYSLKLIRRTVFFIVVMASSFSAQLSAAALDESYDEQVEGLTESMAHIHLYNPKSMDAGMEVTSLCSDSLNRMGIEIPASSASAGSCLTYNPGFKTVALQTDYRAVNDLPAKMTKHLTAWGANLAKVVDSHWFQTGSSVCYKTIEEKKWEKVCIDMSEEYQSKESDMPKVDVRVTRSSNGTSENDDSDNTTAPKWAIYTLYGALGVVGVGVIALGVAITSYNLYRRCSQH